MLKNIKDFICMHLNFKVYNVTVAAIIAALAIAPCVMFLPESYGFENGVLENLQLIVLFLGFIFALMAKDNKKFFLFCSNDYSSSCYKRGKLFQNRIFCNTRGNQ